jgi:hypothetical protein
MTDSLTDERVLEIAEWTPHPAMNALSPYLPHLIEKSALARRLLGMTVLARYAASCAGEERADIERRINEIVRETP